MLPKVWVSSSENFPVDGTEKPQWDRIVHGGCTGSVKEISDHSWCVVFSVQPTEDLGIQGRTERLALVGLESEGLGDRVLTHVENLDGVPRRDRGNMVK